MRLLWPALSLVLSASIASGREPLDGNYLTIGPLGAAACVGDEWVSAVGGELSWVNVAETRFPAAFGVAAGGVSYGGRRGGRFWLEGEAALGAPIPLGLGIGFATEVDPVNPWRPGVQATLWVFTGIVPYARVGTVTHSGTFFEAGVMLKVPARRFP